MTRPRPHRHGGPPPWAAQGLRCYGFSLGPSALWESPQVALQRLIESQLEMPVLGVENPQEQVVRHDHRVCGLLARRPARERQDASMWQFQTAHDRGRGGVDLQRGFVERVEVELLISRADLLRQ